MSEEVSLKTLREKKAQADGSGADTVDPGQEIRVVEKEAEALTPDQRREVDEIRDKIDVTDAASVEQFGLGPQKSIADFSAQILNHVRTKDGGQAGELMADLSVKVREVGIDDLDGGLLSRLPFFKEAGLGLQKFIKRYQTIEVQIDQIETELDRQRMDMLKDISMFDTLYARNLDYFKGLQIYIAAGEEKLEELKDQVIPRLREEARASGDMMDAQLVKDYEDSVSRFEKKLYDLKLSKTIAIQTAPQIRMVQNNDRLLVEKIQTAILATIPLWKSQIVMSLGLEKQKKVLDTQRAITDATNELLTRNAESLKQNTVDVANESERGIVDLETLKKVNDNLIETIDETIRIQKEGSEKRKQAEAELSTIEGQLRQKLLTASGYSKENPPEGE